ncbi:hypothetical protein OTERR_12800 [Oryzomicrobium terrae]|uniref:NinB protein n=1 Tax=Oryzomicrobium terrae TaxID=1735038 RepID=A0A5C1E749_9RHOO|nr:hypothetical protein [Oryzomicrobium terrae]QEL64756.1 hypothetical protein OTERR_12800 [Oryzomicrobium terrae]
MADQLLRAHWPSQAVAGPNFSSVIAPWCKSMWEAGHKLEIEIRLHEDAKTDKQRRFYHGVVLKQIALQARPNGQTHALAVWKEYFRDHFIGFKTVTYKDPMTGKKTRRRVRQSTEDLGVKGYSKLIDQVTAFAVTELGVRFPVDWATFEAREIDMETGEILG